MTRRQFSLEFKREAPYLVTQRGVSVAQAARGLDLHAMVLRRWVNEFGIVRAKRFRVRAR